MRTPPITHGQQGGTLARHVPAATSLSEKSVGRFVMHFLEMRVVHALGAAVLCVLFFGTAALLGYAALRQQRPELTVLIMAISLSLPMAAWMRFTGMDWRPTLDMSGSLEGRRRSSSAVRKRAADLPVQ